MFSVSRLARLGYVFGLSVPIVLLLGSSPSRGQFRGSPTIFIPIASGSSASGGSSAAGFIGGAAGSTSGSTGTSITLAQIRMLGLPAPLFQPLGNNGFTDTTGVALFLGHSPMGIGIMMPLGTTAMSGILGGIGGSGTIISGVGGGGFSGGGLGMGGGGMGGMGGMGMRGGGMGGGGMGGGMGGFAGKGMGGFNGKKAL